MRAGAPDALPSSLATEGYAQSQRSTRGLTPASSPSAATARQQAPTNRARSTNSKTRPRRLSATSTVSPQPGSPSLAETWPGPTGAAASPAKVTTARESTPTRPPRSPPLKSIQSPRSHAPCSPRDGALSGWGATGTTPRSARDNDLMAYIPAPAPEKPPMARAKSMPHVAGIAGSKMPHRKRGGKRERLDSTPAAAPTANSYLPTILRHLLLHSTIGHQYTVGVGGSDGSRDVDAWVSFDVSDGYVPVHELLSSLTDEHSPDSHTLHAYFLAAVEDPRAEKTLQEHTFTEDHIREAVAADELQRFELSDDGEHIRAVPSLLPANPALSSASQPALPAPTCEVGMSDVGHKLEAALQGLMDQTDWDDDGLLSGWDAPPPPSPPSIHEIDGTAPSGGVAPTMACPEYYRPPELGESDPRLRLADPPPYMSIGWLCAPPPRARAISNSSQKSGGAATRAVTSHDAPPLALIGWYSEHMPRIMQSGLSRMLRHHTLIEMNAKTSPGADTASVRAAGGGRPFDAFIWVDVPAAIDGGVEFHKEHLGEGLVCDGISGDGVLPAQFIALVIDVKGHVAFDARHARLVERLFPDCARVEVYPMSERCEGADDETSGQLLSLRAQRFDQRGRPLEPALIRIDTPAALATEVAKINEVAGLVGTHSAMRVMRGPEAIDSVGRTVIISQDGHGTVGDDHEEPALAAVVLEAAGACWALPEFHAKLAAGAELTATFGELLHAALNLGVGASGGAPRKSPKASAAGAPGGAEPVEKGGVEAAEDGARAREGRSTPSANRRSANQPNQPAKRAGHGSSPTAAPSASTPRKSAAGGASPATRRSGSGQIDETGRWSSFGPPSIARLEAVVRELWESGGALNNMALSAPSRPGPLATSPGGAVDAWLSALTPYECELDAQTRAPLVALLEQLRQAAADTIEDDPWLANHSPLHVYRHGHLAATNVLVDVRGSSWLLELSSAGRDTSSNSPNPSSPFADAAMLVAELLFERMPLKLNDEKLCQQRVTEACTIIDELFAPMNGAFPELWLLARREPPASWPAHSTLIFRLVTRIVRLACELAVKCSAREQLVASGDEDAPADPADTHAAHFLMALLLHAIDCRGRLGSWHEQVAQHAALRIARALADEGVLMRAPVTPTELLASSAAPAPRTELHLADDSLVVMLVQPESCMDGDEGATRLAKVRPAGGALPSSSSLFGATKLEKRLTFDGMSQVVLPWQAPLIGAIDGVLASAERSYDALREVASLGSLVPQCEAASPSTDSADNTDAHDEVTPTGMDAVAERVCTELVRLQGSCAPLESMLIATISKVLQVREGAATARSEAAAAASSSEDAQSAADMKASEASDAEELASGAVATARIAEEKRLVAVAEQEVAATKMREVVARFEKERSMAVKGRRPLNGLAQSPADEATTAAEGAAAAATTASNNAELADSRAKVLVKAAEATEQESTAAQAAAAEAAECATMAAARATVGEFRSALLRALAIDVPALEATIETWAFGELRQTGAGGVRRYAAGQRLVVFDPKARVGDSWLDVQVAEAPSPEARDRQFKQEPTLSARPSSAPSAPTPASPRPARAAPRAVARVDTTDAEWVAAPSEAVPGARRSPTKKQLSAKRTSKSASRELFADPPAMAPPPAMEPAPAPIMEVSESPPAASAPSACMRSAAFDHKLRASDGRLFTLPLHPWNHGPAEMPSARFDALRKRHTRAMLTQHATLVDAVSGRRFDVIDECVPVEVRPAAGDGASDMAAVRDVAGLAAWLQATHVQACADGLARTSLCVLITAGPASGKTCLMSQMVSHVLREGTGTTKPGHLLPIVIKVQRLQRLLMAPQHRPTFARSWNFVDAFLQLEHGAASDAYAMLRQAMAARRALLLIDGIDEGGQVRGAIERHVTNVLAAQGHPLVVTSRPAGLHAASFVEHGFHHLELVSLSDVQQQRVLEQRLGAEGASLANVPLDAATGKRVTANPLMLSVVISVFEGRMGGGNGGNGGMRDSQRPTSAAATGQHGAQTTVALYEAATTAVLAREGLVSANASGDTTRHRGRGSRKAAGPSGGVVPHLTALLQASFFEAHAAQRRIIEEGHVEEAALGLAQPEVLARLRAEMPPYHGRAEAGHYVEVLTGEHMGRRGVVSHRPFRVAFDDGTLSAVLREADFLSSGLSVDEGRAFEQRQRERRGAAVSEACAQLPTVVSDALWAVRERVRSDKLPLLTMLSSEPLQMQSSHLSFQEYYTARAICEGRRLPAVSAAPWRWESWWLNTLHLGSELGETFGVGLVAATGEEASHLELGGKVGGHRPTALLAVAQLLRGASSVSLAQNCLTPTEGLQIADGVRLSSRLTVLNLANNRLAGVWFEHGVFRGEFTANGLLALARAVASSPSLRRLDLSQNSLGVAYIDGVRVNSMNGIVALAEAVGKSNSLRELVIGYNSLGPAAGVVLGEATARSRLTELDISGNLVGVKGARAVCDAALANTELCVADLRFNSFNVQAKELLREAEASRSGLRFEL